MCAKHWRLFSFYLFHLIFFDSLHPCRCLFLKAKKLFALPTRPAARPSWSGFFTLSAAISCLITLFSCLVLPCGRRTFSEMHLTFPVSVDHQFPAHYIISSRASSCRIATSIWSLDDPIHPVCPYEPLHSTYFHYLSPLRSPSHPLPL